MNNTETFKKQHFPSQLPRTRALVSYNFVIPYLDSTASETHFKHNFNFSLIQAADCPMLILLTVRNCSCNNAKSLYRVFQNECYKNNLIQLLCFQLYYFTLLTNENPVVWSAEKTKQTAWWPEFLSINSHIISYLSKYVDETLFIRRELSNKKFKNKFWLVNIFG